MLHFSFIKLLGLLLLVLIFDKSTSFLNDLNHVSSSGSSIFLMSKEKGCKFLDVSVCNNIPMSSSHLDTLNTALFSSSDGGTETYPLTRQGRKGSGLGEGDKLFGSIKVVNALTGETSPLSSLLSSKQPTVVCWFTHMGDFNTFEYGQKLKYSLPKFQAKNAKVIAIGIGTRESGLEFCKCFDFPKEMLYLDESAASYSKMNFSKGFGAGIPINPYLKLFPMLMGIGSPGTLQAVFKGYIGSKSDSSDWAESYLTLVDRSAFDVLGKEGARPFEIATVRLENMMNIIPKWELLAPPDKSLITQQGGTAIFDQDKNVVWTYKDKGILVYTNIDDVLDNL